MTHLRPVDQSHRLYRKTGKRFIWSVIFLISAFLIGVGIILSSLWIEDHYPSSDTKRALMPTAQRLVSRPIVKVVRNQVERYARRRAEALYMKTGLTLEQTIDRFLDERIDLSQRRIYAYRLARIGTPECVAALLKVLRTAPSEHKAFIAQLVGSTGNPEAKTWLLPLLGDTDEGVVIATIHGLSVIGGSEITTLIREILADSKRSEPIRIQAALGLGTIGTPVARNALIDTLTSSPSSALGVQILNSLGHLEFPMIADTFEQYLAAPDSPQTMRVAAVEALANSSTEAVPFLLQVTSNDRNPDVRASSAWAISAHEIVNDLGPILSDLAEREPAADVRRRLYEALVAQSAIPAARLLNLVRNEQDLAARVAGFNAVGRAVYQQPGSDVAMAFDSEAVPELLKVATSPNSLNLQMRSVFALRRAQTEAARAALEVIANSARPQIATAARNGLPQRKI
jgi:HEAT repeat protein